jgi:hypothetical protein
MQDALRPEDQYRLSSPYDLHECETTLSIEQTVIHALVTQLLEESTTLDREAFKKLRPNDRANTGARRVRNTTPSMTRFVRLSDC